MLYFNVDARDGNATVQTCQTCCCQPLTLSPGETNLVQVNYAAWALPIGYPGLTKGSFQYSVDRDVSACTTTAIDGFSPPVNSNYSLSTTAGTQLTIDLSASVEPSANTFTYKTLPLRLPKNGTLTQAGISGGASFIYTPNAGFTGYDYFTFETTDAQGRSVVNEVEISVGTHNQQKDRARMAVLPFIDTSKVVLLHDMHIVQFALTMPMSCKSCESYRLTILQQATDCARNIFTHQSCFDVMCRSCV